MAIKRCNGVNGRTRFQMSANIDPHAIACVLIVLIVLWRRR